MVMAYHGWMKLQYLLHYKLGVYEAISLMLYLGDGFHSMLSFRDVGHFMLGFRGAGHPMLSFRETSHSTLGMREAILPSWNAFEIGSRMLSL